MEGNNEELEYVKVKDLQPKMGNVNIVVKILDMGEEREVRTRRGDTRRLREVRVADSTGSILMTLWDDQGKDFKENDTIMIVNGYISLVRGHMRLGLGRYGSFEDTDEVVEEVSEEPDMSEKEYEMEPRGYRRGYSQGRGQGRGRYGSRWERGE
ncbi:MAG: single-stranded DNA-binding protein [Thermoplasmata archaeon]|nr:single-stranded DNA-binding protein [Thermoplasmata archaeon]